MPYTPPHRSPSASAPSSPETSRRPSFQSGDRPSLPRSASYLSRHRRTPSAPAVAAHGSGVSIQQTPPGTSDDLKSLATSRSLRQSPPPLTDGRGMPKGAVATPPESSSSGSDDEEDAAVRGRKLENLKELKDAISQIPLHRESSPNRSRKEVLVLSPIAMQSVAADGIYHSFSTGSLSNLNSRRTSHARSSTDPSVVIPKSADNSLTTSDESESEGFRKPQMVRKKSGELVRPALRASSRRRPSSMPGTPTFSKAVHFDAHLEHVRHFLQVDRPLAVSVGSSPVDSYDSDTEYPFSTRTLPFEWEILTSNFPTDSPIRTALPVRLERVWLSKDQKFLHGSVVVANLAFQKNVVCRFTLDYWKTTSEVGADYSHEIRPSGAVPGCDRFTFAIKLADMAHLESKTLFFCIRYNVLGREYWDNNNSMNFQVDFRKRHLPQNGKPSASSRSTGSLPRSNRRSNPNTAPRPKSLPVGFDDFSDSSEFKMDKDVHEVLGESESGSIKLKNRQSGNTPSDMLPGSLSPPRGQAFANRYDFSASLSAVKKLSKETKHQDSDALYMRHHRRTPSATSATSVTFGKSRPDNKPVDESKPSPVGSVPQAAHQTAKSQPGDASPSTSLESSSYEDLVAKYCFYVPKQPNPSAKDATPRPAANPSNSGSHPVHHAGPAQHHSLRTPSPVVHESPAPRMPSPSVVAAALATSPALDYLSGPSVKTVGQGSPSTIRSASPASIVGGLSPFPDSSPNELPYHTQHLQDRFPFSPESHSSPAIRG